MAQDIVVSYRADVDDLTNKLKIVIDRMDKLEAESKQAAKGIDQTTKSADKLGKELVDTGKEVKKTTGEVKDFSKTANKELSGLGKNVGAIGAGIAAGIAAAFSVQAIIAFGKASVEAFLVQEESLQKLKNAVINVAGGTERAFDRLVKQSGEIQKISIFGDETIQSAQAALIAFGLTADEVEKLIPKLADFATVAGIDIVAAAEQVGQGLQGAGREFKKYGIELSATATETENYNKILEGLTKFTGSAEDATKSYGGQIKQVKNEVGDLQEEVGQKLIPVFLKFQQLGLRLVKSLVNDFKSLFSIFSDRELTKVEKAQDQFRKLGVEFNVLAETIKKGNLTQEQRKDLITELNTEYGQYLPNLVSETASLQEIEKAQAAVNKQLEGRIILVALEEEITRITRNAVQATKALLDVEKARTKARLEGFQSAAQEAFVKERLNDDEALANELIRKSRDELAGLQDQYAKLAAQLGINLDLTEKLGTAQAGSDVRIAGSAAEVKQIQALASEYSDLFALLSDLEKQKLIELSIKATVEDDETIRRKIKQLEQIIIDNKLDIEIKLDSTDPNKKLNEIRDEYARLKTEVESNGILLSAEFDQTNLATLREEVAKLAIQLQKDFTIPITLEVPDDRKVKDAVKDASGKVKQGLDDDTSAILQASSDLLSSVAQLSSVYTEKRLEDIAKQTQAQLDAITIQDEAVTKNYEKGRITERQAQAEHAKLLAQRVETEKKAAEKERQIKRKQAILDKAAALAAIAISTAQNIASTPLPPLWALYAALGAAQAAIVVAQPIPYKKGSKNTKGGLSRVGEEGEEILFIPGGSKVLPAQKTKTYGQVLDKMFDGTFDKHYMKREITPQLTKQITKIERIKEKTFANNITESIFLNQPGITGHDLERVRQKGQKITNVDELADAITKRITLSPYRR